MSLSDLKASPSENNNLKIQVKPDMFIKNSKEDDQADVWELNFQLQDIKTNQNNLQKTRLFWD